ncbi:hypothetical protein F3J45_16485 [Pantoea sp. Ap-967]|uniref:dermonecrotic toxin domain-containing protein n=1 Tax=Pantoea sp. Ap-967 TaxID=2608362 RepID=UPI0014239A52|nr:DUF6543 domain-containing protein [Pantoea sp. Ap-967]NIE76036.1 hypothetical protein [Pantoea sp. Ap-967]
MSEYLPADFKTLVATQFATRPTLREVLARRLLAILEHTLPAIASVQPPLGSAEAVTLISPHPTQPHWVTQPLVDVALQAVLDQQALGFLPIAGRAYKIGLAAPHRFAGDDDSLGYLDLGSAGSAINELLAELPVWFQQAQVDYWNAMGSAGVSRERWLQLVVKMALLQGLPLQGLDDQQQRCVRGLLKGGDQAPTVFAVQATLTEGERRRQVCLPALLVTGEWDEREVILWCAPSGVIRAFDTLDAFAIGLRDQLAGQYRFEHMSWDRYALQGDAFAYQATLMLEGLFERLAQVPYTFLKDVEHLQRVFLALSDPSSHFVEGYLAPAAAALPAPPGLARARAADSFAYQSALLALALDQLDSDGIAALDGIPDLHTYTQQRLAEAMQADHAQAALYDSDDLLLELAIARGEPGGAGVGSGGGEPLESLGQKTLTQFAIGNLGSLHGAFIKGIAHRTGRRLPGWLNADYLKRLVGEVDIGGHYPQAVAQQLDERSQRPERVRRFAREWRSALVFLALSARLEGGLSEAGLQVIVDYCRGHVDRQTPNITLFPLAFKPRQASTRHDLVRGAYVVFSAEPRRALLYCPLFEQPVLKEFASLEAMLQAIRQSDVLQQSLLAWMAPDAHSLYAHGGFADPHVAIIGIDPYNLPEQGAPALLDVQLWLSQVDEKLYAANRDLLVELAQLQSTSTARSRWERLAEGAWLLFDTATLLIGGPVASVAWLLQLFKGLDDDLQMLAGHDAFGRSAAVVDVLLNLGLALLHQRQPTVPALPPAAVDPARLVPRLPLRPVVPAAQVAQGKTVLAGAMPLAASQLDLRFRGNQGFNYLTAENKRALQRLAVAVALEGVEPIASGVRQGLHEVDGAYYLTMAGLTYHVGQVEGGIRIFDGQQLTGPWLQFEAGAWRIDRAMRGLGGMPKRRVERMKEANMALLESLQSRESRLLTELNDLGENFKKHRRFLNKSIEDLDAYPGEANDERHRILTNLMRQSRLRLLADMKQLVEKGIVHDELVSQIAAVGRTAVSMQEAIRLQRNTTRHDLIERCDLYTRELSGLIAQANLQGLGDSIAVLPETDAEKQSYLDYYQQVEAVVGWRTDLVNLSGKFDALLENTLGDRSVVFRDEDTGERIGKEAWLGQIIEERRLTSIDQQFGLLMDLAEASLNRLAPIDEQVLVDYAGYLASAELKSSGSAHGEVAAQPDLKERVDILSGVLQDYQQAEAMSDYLASLGGEGIRQAPLAAYRKVLKGLMDAIQEDLNQAVRELELAEPRRPRVTLYASRGGRRKVVTTRRGHKVVGEETDVDGETVIQQLDFRKAVLKTFHQHDGQWVEDSGTSPTSPEPALPGDDALGAARAEGLLAQVEQVIALARQYVKSDEPRGLETVIDGHIEKLAEFTGKLTVATHETLHEALNDGIDRLRLAKDDLLRGLYLTTRHPTADSLRFLLRSGEVTVTRSEQRKPTQAGDYLDIYEIRRRPVGKQAQGSGLWEAHFHYRAQATPALEFDKGHLKIWSERKLGRNAQMRAAQTRNELLFIYRGELKAQQVADLFPFA